MLLKCHVSCLHDPERFPKNDSGRSVNRWRLGTTLLQRERRLSARIVLFDRLSRPVMRCGGSLRTWLSSTQIPTLVGVYPLFPTGEQIVGNIKRPLLVLMAGPSLILLYRFNAASLMLVRAACRRKEMALHLALGASARQVFANVLVGPICAYDCSQSVRVLLALSAAATRRQYGAGSGRGHWPLAKTKAL
jgi:hypothetical protein